LRKLGFQAISTAWKCSVKDRLIWSLCFHRENMSLVSVFSLILPENVGLHDQIVLTQTQGLKTKSESVPSQFTIHERSLLTSFEK